MKRERNKRGGRKERRGKKKEGEWRRKKKRREKKPKVCMLAHCSKQYKSPFLSFRAIRAPVAELSRHWSEDRFCEGSIPDKGDFSPGKKSSPGQKSLKIADSAPFAHARRTSLRA